MIMATLNKFIGSDAFYVLFVLAVLTLGLFGYLLMFALSLPYIGNQAAPQKRGALYRDISKLPYNFLILISVLLVPAIVYFLDPNILLPLITYFSHISYIPIDADAYTRLALERQKPLDFYQSFFFISYIGSKITILFVCYMCVNFIWSWRSISTAVGGKRNSKNTPLQGLGVVALIALGFFALLFFLSYGAQLTGSLLTDSIYISETTKQINQPGHRPLFLLISQYANAAFFLLLVTITSINSPKIH